MGCKIKLLTDKKAFMSNKKFDILAQKNIGQIKFRPTMQTYSDVTEIAAVYEENFEEWIAAKNSSITLLTPEDKKLLQLTFESTTAINEKIRSIDESSEEIKELVKLIKGSFGDFSESLKEIRRIGFRTTLIIDFGFSYVDLVDLIFKYRKHIIHLNN